MSKPSPFLVDGQNRTSSETLEVKNPFNGEVISTVCRPSVKDVEAAIQSSVDDHVDLFATG